MPLKQRQLHLQRMGTDTQTREIWETIITGKRRRGRLRMTWKDGVDAMLERRGDFEAILIIFGKIFMNFCTVLINFV